VKKKIILLSLLALLLMVVAMFAMVPPAKACSKTAITVVLGPETPSNAKYVVCQSGTEYLEYFKITGTLFVFAGTHGYGDLPTTPIALVSFADVCWGTYNTVTNVGLYTFYEVWTLPSGGQLVGFDHPVTATGDFISVATGNQALSAVGSHIVVCGSGQVIDVSSTNLFTAPWNGYWLAK